MRKYFAPGRINLIGEHIDYNGGLVLPAAISLGVTATVESGTGGYIAFSSATHTEQIKHNIQHKIDFNPELYWLNYPLGVVKFLQEHGVEIPSLDIRFESNLPEGSGLSSSAAVEVLTMFLLLNEAGKTVPAPQIALWCKQIENNFIGVQCGIMDQFVVASGRAGHALLLNCDNLEHEYVPASFGDYELLIMNTKKPRNLIHSKYNERKAECEAALYAIQQHNKENTSAHLCAATTKDLQCIKDKTLFQRARHVITEHQRVISATDALRHGDVAAFGKLLNESHQSLKHDYEVSGMELDTIVEAAVSTSGCIGARMTGAGFGGCAIALVHRECVKDFTNTVFKHYELHTGLAAEFYPCSVVDGVKQITS